MRADSRIITTALRNINDAVSAVNIVDGALGELSDVIIRITELAEQSANGVFTDEQRQALDTEAQALRAEYERIAESTSFNGLGLLNGEVAAIDVQAGKDGSENSSIRVNTSELASRSVGTGNFDAPAELVIQGRFGQYQAADLNNDGVDDIVGIIDNALGNSGVVYAIANGDGTFQTTQQVASSGFGGQGLAIADVNGDGNLDIFFQDGGTSDDSLVLGNGNGTFQSKSSFTGGSGDIFLEDINGDGNVDYVGRIGTDLVTRLGDGNGSFGSAITSSVLGSEQNFTVGDFNGDGRVDVVGADFTQANLFTANANGSFNAAASITSGDGGRGITAADIDGDGNLDLIGSSNNSLDIQYGNGNGTFGSEVSIVNEDSSEFVAADLNDDGLLDLVGEANTRGLFISLINNGDGSFTEIENGAPSFGDGLGRGAAVGDFNGDGVLDAIYNGDDSSNIYLQQSVQAAGLSSFSLLTQSDARSALTTLTEALTSLSSSRGELGASLGRLQTSANALEVERVNTLEAESRIRDVDVSSEAANNVRTGILQQVSASILAQANQAPALALALIG